MKKHPRALFPLLWIMLFDHTSLNITFPMLTLLFFDLQSRLFPPDTSQAVRSMWYGICIAIPHIINIIITPLLSALSDELGRKKILLFGTFGALLFAITAALGVLFGMLSLLLLSRLIQGAFSRTNPIAQAVIGDIATHHNKIVYMGYLQTAISIGAFIGPIIGGYVARPFLFGFFNFSLPFFIASFFAFISFILTMILFNETLTEKPISHPRKLHFPSIKNVLFNRHVWHISLVLLLSQISWSMYYQFIPPILKTVLHFDAHQIGIFVGLIAFWLALATTFGIRLLQRFFNLHHMLMLSLYLVFIGLLLSFLFCFIHLDGNWTLLIWLAAIPIAIGDVIAYSVITTLYSNTVKKAEQGKVMGVCFIVVALIWAMTGMLGGMLMSIHYLLPLIIAPLGIIFAIVFLHFFSRNLISTQ
jgi:MFS family permease